LRQLREQRKLQAAFAVGEWLHAQSKSAEQRLPNAMHYEAILFACADEAHHVAALELLDAMKGRGCAVSAQAIVHAINACVRSRDAEALQHILPLLDEMDSISNGPSPDAALASYAYARTIRAFDEAGNWEGALEIGERARSQGVASSAHGYRALLAACRRGQQAKRACALIEEVKSDPGVQLDSGMYSLAIGACDRAGAWESALALFDNSRQLAAGTEAQAHGDAYCYSAAIHACAQGKQWERALQLLEDMRAQHELIGDPRFAWNNAMAACNAADQWAHTLALFERLATVGLEPNEHSVVAAIQACRHSSDAQRAADVFDAHGQHSPMCLDAVLRALVDADEHAMAVARFETSKQRMRQLGAHPTASSFELAIEACGSVDSDRALVLWAELQGLAHAP
jgi:pentatricopeptide repeat domain-containing protein 1